MRIIVNQIHLCIVILLFILEAVHSRSRSRDETFCVKLDGGDVCHAVDDNPYRYYGTKTAYHIATSNKAAVRDTSTEGCVPKVFYLLSRHATRYPKKDDIIRMEEQLPVLKEKIIKSFSEGKAHMCSMDIEVLRNWKLNMTTKDDNRLSQSGMKEAYDLAQRYKSVFPEILNKSYTPQDFVFEYTSRSRTRTTAESFAKGLFGEKGFSEIDFDKKENDKVLQFHKDCKKLREKCNDYPAKIKETEKFMKSPLVQAVIESVSKRLGFFVTKDDIKIMYRACAFGYALGESDAWCSVFSNDELKVLEYESDVDDYYKDSYGNEVSYKQACVWIKYLINLLKSSLTSSNTKAILQFSHAGAIKKVYSRLGLYRDSTPLTAAGPCVHQDRKWRSSFVCPFNSNLAVVLYQCKNEHKLAIFHDEQKVVVNGCTTTLCPMQEFLAKYRSISKKCSLKKICCSCCSPKILYQ